MPAGLLVKSLWGISTASSARAVSADKPEMIALIAMLFARVKRWEHGYGCDRGSKIRLSTAAHSHYYGDCSIQTVG